MNSFSGMVSVSESGLPTGVTATPATLNLAPGIPQTITLAAAASVTSATPTITFMGTSGGITHSATVALTIQSLFPDFSLSVTPASATITSGGAGAPISVLASSMNSFSGMVSVSVSGLPTGVTATPATLNLAPGIPQTITLSAAASVTSATPTITFTGTSGGITHSATVALTIQSLFPDFSLSVTPASATITSGGAGAPISVLANSLNSFSGTVSVSVSGLPAGVTATPATLSLAPGTPQTITLSAAASITSATPTITFTGTSGGITHSATVTLTIQSLFPDFSLSVTPASATITSGGAGAPISVLASSQNSFSSAVSVSVSGLPTGVTAAPATLNLAPGIPQTITLSAAANVTSATPTITFTGTSGGVAHSATVVLTIQGAVLSNAPDITTYHNDVARDGLNAQETILTLSNVNSTLFGKIGFDAVDGLVDAQPLYLANVIAGGHLHNVLYVATEHDSVFAFDADTGEQIWKTSVIGSGEITSDDRNCSQVTPEIGITSTPVIDRKQGTNGTLFAIAVSKDAKGNYHQRLHALDITTGAENAGSPIEIAASYPSTGGNSSNADVVFDPSQYNERAALLLLNGNIYTGWSSHCDDPPYTGWVMAFNEATLRQTQVLNLTPNGSDGSIWMSGGGLAAGDGGYIYFLDANGTFDTTLDGNGFPAKSDFGNAILKLSTNGRLAVADYFEPYNTVAESANDVDLGSGGAVLLPDQTDAQGNVRHLLAGGGKDANLYVADRDHLGKFNAGASDNSNLYQFIQGAFSGDIFSTPAFFNGVLYVGAVGDVLKAFPVTKALIASSPSSRTAAAFPYPGTTPSVSANGTQNGIVWALESNTSAAAVLHAYDATNLANELYNSQQASNGRDSFGNGNKFITPLVVNGKVYVGTPTGVAVFGLLSH
jgi:hypothetical protein